METVCLLMTENNYYYLGTLIDCADYTKWATEVNCMECGDSYETIFGVTHFLIPTPTQHV